MTRSQYDELSTPLVRVLLDMEDDILQEIAAQLSKDGDISDTSKWRMRQLARAGRLDKRTASIIASYSEAETGQAMDAILAAAEGEISYLDKAVQAANAEGLTEYFTDIPAEKSAHEAAKAFQKQAKSDLNLVNTVMRYKAKSAYVNAVNNVYKEADRQKVLDVMGKAAAKAVSGQMSLQEVTRKTIRELASKGIPAFVDKAGREWSPEAYIMMDMRSTLGNTARAAQDKRCDSYGINLIEVSSHMGARPLCAPYQGRIFSRDGSSGVTTDGTGRKISYTPLSATSYGKPAGLFGINCGHVQYPFSPGISFQRYFPYNEEENAEKYKEFQQQRYLERQVRAAKRECMMLNEVGDKEGFAKASLRLKQRKEEYKSYSNAHGLYLHNDRTQVHGFDRSVSSKSVWSGKKAGENTAKERGISGKHTEANSENTVNLNYIHSPEYKYKFKGITGDNDVDNQIYSQAKAMLIHRNGTNKEDMCLISSTTSKIAGKQYASRSEFGVDYNQSLNNAISDNSPNTLISIHNHPTNNPPTGSDIISNGAHKYKLGVVVTHNGKVFTYKAGCKRFTSSSFSKTVDKFRKKGYNEYNAIIETLKSFEKEYGIEWSERL